MDLFVGSHYEAGFQIGHKYGSIIKQFLNHEYSADNLDSIIEIPTYYALIHRYYPQYLDEIMGLADGARVKFKYLFIYMCYELWYNRHNHCSDLVVKGNATQKEPLLLLILMMNLVIKKIMVSYIELKHQMNLNCYYSQRHV